ncbi:MAG: YegP family protein [Gammaproteobacteria bacterium]|nr:YegP family protein [Gammaproteobacteria bacterium]
MAGKFEVYQDKAGETRFRLKAGNGETILASEGYKSKSSAINGVEAVQKNAKIADRFEVKTAKTGLVYFVLKAGNNQVIGQSEMYETNFACDVGIKSVAASAPGAKVVEVA